MRNPDSIPADQYALNMAIAAAINEDQLLPEDVV